MGDTGSMLLGLLLAYGPISSTASLDQNILVNYCGRSHPVNRFPTILPLVIPVAIWIIPYTDMVLAVIRRTLKGMSPFDADRQHLHHRLLNMGHSHRSAVLLMYLWAALFSGLVVGLSVLRISLIWFARHHARRYRGAAARDGAEAPPVARRRASGSGPGEAAPVRMTWSPPPPNSPHRASSAGPPPGVRPPFAPGLAGSRARPGAAARGLLARSRRAGGRRRSGERQRHAGQRRGAARRRPRAAPAASRRPAPRSRCRRRRGRAAPDLFTSQREPLSKVIRTGAASAWAARALLVTGARLAICGQSAVACGNAAPVKHALARGFLGRSTAACRPFVGAGPLVSPGDSHVKSSVR